jgi:hypothetical protein
MDTVVLGAILSGAQAAAGTLAEPSGSQQRTYGDPSDEPGFLLSGDPERVAAHLKKLWETQRPLVARHLAQCRVNELRRKGITNVRLNFDEKDGWGHYAVPGASPDIIPTFNKGAALCRRLTGLMFADPPAPEVTPPPGADTQDRARVEFTIRVLEDIQGENQLDTPRKLRRAFDRASNGGSAFLHYYVDPYGGGREPIRVEAAPFARHIEEATLNPDTGAPWSPTQAAVFRGEEWDGEYAERFVRQDGSLTESESEAATRWAPALKSEVVDSRNVRFIPHTAEDIWSADAVMIGSMPPWGEVKARYAEELGEISPAERDALLNWKPEDWYDLQSSGRASADTNEVADERPCFVLEVYHTACARYPQGARVIVVGGRRVVHRDTWGSEVEGRWETHLIPLSQVKHLSEGDDEPMGHGMMEILGPGNELLAAVLGSFLDYLDDLNNRKTFVPTTSTVRLEAYAARGKRFIPFTPGGGQPVTEQTPPYPREGFNALSLIPQWMDSASGLEQAAQGVEDPSVQSGTHAQTIIGQVHAGLSELKQNVMRAYVRACQIELQLIRAYYTVPRILQWDSADGEYRAKAWMGADLISSRDIKIRKGTMTMLTPEQKAQMAMGMAGQGMLPVHRARALLAAGVGPAVGIQNDPHLMRVQRQIAKWSDGAPKVDPEMLEQYRAQVGQYQQDAAVHQQAEAQFMAAAQDALAQGLDPTSLGAPPQPPQPPVNPFAEALAAIFDPRLVDVDPAVATVRYHELGELMASVAYERHAPEWREGVDAEFARMQQALAPPPAPLGVAAQKQ